MGTTLFRSLCPCLIITFHDFLHGFWSGCGTGTATLEAKLLRKLAAFRE